MKYQKPTYEELEARVKRLDMKFKNLAHYQLLIQNKHVTDSVQISNALKQILN